MIGREGMGCRLFECFFLRDLSSQSGPNSGEPRFFA